MQRKCVEKRGVSSNEYEFMRSALHLNAIGCDGKYVPKPRVVTLGSIALSGVISRKSTDRLDCRRLCRRLHSFHAGNTSNNYWACPVRAAIEVLCFVTNFRNKQERELIGLGKSSIFNLHVR